MQLHDINRQLEQVRADIRRRDHAQQQARSVQAQLDEAWQRLDDGATQFEAAEERLEDLEGLSLTGLFARLLGNQREKRDEARDELLRCKLRHDAAREEVEPLQAQLEQIRATLEALDDVDARHGQALDAKAAYLAAEGGERGRRIVEASERIGTIAETIREIDEAIAAGLDARRELSAALDALGSARSWGQFDIMGGGVIATSIKHGRIDRAQSHIGRAQRHLRRFVRELEDVDIAGGGLDVKIEGFSRFADYFFDGLISDWHVQSRIVDSQARTRSTRQRTSDLVHLLERRRAEWTDELEATRAQRASWIDAQ